MFSCYSSYLNGNIKIAGMPRSVNTPQEQILHSKSTLFNFTHTLYQTRYDYFDDLDALDIKCSAFCLNLVELRSDFLRLSRFGEIVFPSHLLGNKLFIGDALLFDLVPCHLIHAAPVS